jgi:hypothetical protein
LGARERALAAIYRDRGSQGFSSKRLCTKVLKRSDGRNFLTQRRKGAKRYRVSKVFFAPLRLCAFASKNFSHTRTFRAMSLKHRLRLDDDCQGRQERKVEVMFSLFSPLQA